MTQVFRNKYFVVFAMLVLFTISASAQSLDVDTGTFIDAINDWLPLALTIAAIGVGIAGGFKLATFVGRMIINAFDGRL